MQFRKKLALGLLIGWTSFTVLVVSTNFARAAYNQYQATKYNDVSVANLLLRDTGIYDANGVARLAVGATNTLTGNFTVASGTQTISNGGLTVTGGTAKFGIQTSTAPRSANAAVAVVPGRAGEIVFNSTDSELCLSTAANSNAWIEIATGTVTACRH